LLSKIKAAEHRSAAWRDQWPR